MVTEIQTLMRLSNSDVILFLIGVVITALTMLLSCIASVGFFLGGELLYSGVAFIIFNLSAALSLYPSPEGRRGRPFAVIE